MKQLEASKFKYLTTSRNLKYHYYVHKSETHTLPTLLLLHGYPNFSGDWCYQVKHFTDLGYGVIVPDLLGSGGTDKPTDPKLYAMKGMATDLIEILDDEGVDNAVVIGHDWGSGLTARVAQYYPERATAVALLAVGWYPPSIGFDYEKTLELSRAATGSELLGYWRFFCEENSSDVMLEHIESTCCLLFPKEPEIWKDHVAPLGALKQYILEDRKDPIAPYIDPVDLELRKEQWKRDGLKGAVCWYKAMLEGITPAEDAGIPQANYTYSKPVFLGPALKDYVCLAALQEHNTLQFCPNTTIVRFDTSHWIMLEKPNELNEALVTWLKEKVHSG